jgi:hypothetical protein
MQINFTADHTTMFNSGSYIIVTQRMGHRARLVTII